MKEKTLHVLEYNKIIEMLREQAGSEMTKKVISELLPYLDASEIREHQTETTEAVRLIQYKGPLPVGGFYDIEEIVSLARKGGTLTMAQLLKVLYNMKTAERVRSFLKGDVPELPVMFAIAELIAVHKELSEEIDRCIISEDEMADNASPQLRTIRRTIVRQNEALKAKVNHILNSSDNKTILQDAIVTMRNGRYVIPVKQEHKARVPGIVHDQSGSGATLFIEPQAVVNLNNELRQLELDEELLAQKGLHIEKHMASDVTIRGNQDLLTNALDNVLMNAILYSPQGASIRILLDAHTMTIENTGVSIPEEALPQLFTPFYRVEQSRSRQSGGSGLGLYLVRLILELHNASCEIKNSEDGVVFSAQFT